MLDKGFKCYYEMVFLEHTYLVRSEGGAYKIAHFYTSVTHSDNNLIFSRDTNFRMLIEAIEPDFKGKK